MDDDDDDDTARWGLWVALIVQCAECVGVFPYVGVWCFLRKRWRDTEVNVLEKSDLGQWSCPHLSL